MEWAQVNSACIKLRDDLKLIDDGKNKENACSYLLKSVTKIKSYDYPNQQSQQSGPSCPRGSLERSDTQQRLSVLSTTSRQLRQSVASLPVADRISFTSRSYRLILEDVVRLPCGRTDLLIALRMDTELFKQNKENLASGIRFKRKGKIESVEHVVVEIIGNAWQHMGSFATECQKKAVGLRVKLETGCIILLTGADLFLDKDKRISLWSRTMMPPQRDLIQGTRKSPALKRLSLAHCLIKEFEGDVLQLGQLEAFIYSIKSNIATETAACPGQSDSCLHTPVESFNSPRLKKFINCFNDTCRDSIRKVAEGFVCFNNTFLT
jgi:hypothetical protein